LQAASPVTALTASAQTLKIQAGASMSKLDLNTGITRLLGDPLYSPYFGIGLDFFEHKHFNLSAGIGYLQKGGSDQRIISSPIEPEGVPYTAKGKADYITAQASFN
jgi:hypothetical protein